MLRYAPINPRRDLLAQFKRQRRRRELTNQKIADATDLSVETVNVALSGKRMTLETASLIGDALGFSPEHVLNCWMRDEASRLKRKAKEYGQENKAAALGRIYDGLKRWTSWQRQLFCSKGSGRRLALRKLRVCGFDRQPMKKHVSRRKLAMNIVKTKRQRNLGPNVGTVDQVLQAIKLYEGDSLGLDGKGLAVILEALGQELGETISLDALDIVAKQLKNVHSVAQTTPWKCYPGAMQFRPPALVVLDDEYATLSSGRSKTRLGPIEVEFIEMTQLMPEARGTLRIINAWHPGLEVAVVLEGRARLTLSQEPLPFERLEDRIRFEVGVGAVVHDAEYHAGDVVIFDSSLYHRVECLASTCRFVSILLTANVALGRVLE